MLYDLVKIQRGKEEIVATGELSKIRNRKKTMSDSRRGDNISFEIRPSTSTEKLTPKKQNHNRSGDFQVGPRKIKWDKQ